MPSVSLKLADRTLEFVPVPVKFDESRISDLFVRKNNKTVEQTLRHPKYIHLASNVTRAYPDSLRRPLGDFLLDLKRIGNPLYRKFLNRYGDQTYCRFRLDESSVPDLKGLYCFTVNTTPKYIGTSSDTFKRRINQGYGCIHPKNCYRDGQATNCHLNALIAPCAQGLGLFVHPMADNVEIRKTETALIATYQPEWNIQLKRFC